MEISIEEVERINDTPFKVANPETDFGGPVLDWNGGSIANAHMSILFKSTKDEMSMEEYNNLGDFMSNEEAIGKLGLMVKEILNRGK